MSTADDVVEGIVCMQCLMFLISKDGELCNAGFPILCYECWKKRSKKERDNGLPFFEEATGEITTR